MLPKQLFRFRNWPTEGRNRTRELLEEGEFYCSGPREFDDPHDCQLGAHATGSRLDLDRWLLHDVAEIPALVRKYKLSSLTQLNEQTVTDPNDRKILAAIARRNARRHTRVLCLSGEWANELMWAFYGDNHRGVCLCFNTEHQFFQNAKPVLYTHSPVDVEYLANSQGETDHMAYCKSLAWQFQKEWRIVFPDDEPRKVQFPRQILSAVILGYRFPEALLEGLKTILTNGGYGVELFRAERIPETYDFGLINIGRIGPAREQIENRLAPGIVLLAKRPKLAAGQNPSRS